MEQESVRPGLGSQAILPMLLDRTAGCAQHAMSGKQDVPSMYRAVQLARDDGRPITTQMFEGTFHAMPYTCIHELNVGSTIWAI